jgi:hypothetical protein
MNRFPCFFQLHDLYRELHVAQMSIKCSRYQKHHLQSLICFNLALHVLHALTSEFIPDCVYLSTFLLAFQPLSFSRDAQNGL